MTRLGVYVQVPFCQTKCTYCNFHTGVFSKELYAPYVKAVRREIAEFPRLLRENKIANVPESVVDTVYFGGGTPSLLEPASLAQIIEAIRATFPSQFEEVTLEADPETISPEKAAAWREAGFNRISMGVQSFDDAELRAAGRMHRRADVFRGTQILRAAGFANISFDLIAGLPHQTDRSWEDSVEQLLSLRPEHVSIYMMEIDEGSRLGLEVLQSGERYSAKALPTDDAMANYYEHGCRQLAAAGYEHYEISNWGLPGFESRHNLKYWRREPYFGFGAGAHSFNGAQRWANAHDPAAYADSVLQGRFPVEQLETVSQGQALEEELFLGLRQLAGVDLRGIEEKYGAHLRPRVQDLVAQGLVEWDGPRLRLSPERLTVSNEVFVHLLE
ncbi:MAG: radical SAM family heme chaperone HemW [Candidatus Acidiferrales bacterium]